MKRDQTLWRLLNGQWRRFLGLAVMAGLLVLPTAVWAQTSAEVRQGQAYLERGWVEDAIAAFRQALQRNPQSLEAQLGLATAYQRAGRDADAWTAYQAVLRLDPDNRVALTAVGTLGGYRPEWQAQGIVALTRLLQLEPNNQAARAQRALLYGYQGQFVDSLADYEPLLANNPSRDTLLGAAQIYTFSGQYAEGLALFQRAQATGTLPETVLPAYALALQETGQPAEAVALLAPQLQAADRTDFQALQVRSALAVAYGANNQIDQALQTLAPLRQQPAATLPLARALSALGRQQGDRALYEEATRLYQQALAATTNPSYGLRLEVADVLSEWPPTQPEALRLYRDLAQDYPDTLSVKVKAVALAYTLQEQTAAAASQQLAALIPPVPSSPVEQQAIAQALLRLENPDPAFLPTYEALVEAGVAAPLLQFRIAQMHLQQQDYAAAIQALDAYRATPEGATDEAVELLIADIERQSGDLAASAQRYEALIATAPDADLMAKALRGLAFVRTLQGQPEAALAVYETVMAQQPDNLDWPVGRAALGYPIGQVSAETAETALNNWLSAYSREQATPEVLQLVGALPADAARAQLYQDLLVAYPDQTAIRWRTLQLLAATDPAAAQAELEALIAAGPENLTLQFYQGELAQQQGNLTLAALAYETVLAQEPENIGALSGLAGVRFQQGQLQAARTLYEQVLSLEEDWGARYAIAELNAAEGYRLLSLEQMQQLPPAPTPPPPDVARRVEDLQYDLLFRRGFQPPWERY